MSLVPILYTSLILFSILMIVIISFSYIAYKVRNRNASVDEAEEQVQMASKYLRSSPTVPQRRQYESQLGYQTQAIRVVPAIKNPELRRTDLNPLLANRTKVLNHTPKEDPVRNTINAEPPKQNNEFKRRTNAGSYKSRLEIINKIIPQESIKEKFTISGSGTIALPKYYENLEQFNITPMRMMNIYTNPHAIILRYEIPKLQNEL